MTPVDTRPVPRSRAVARAAASAASRALPRGPLAAAMLALAGLGAATAPGVARADTFALGVVGGGALFNIERVGLEGWIDDVFTFRVAEGGTVDFTGFVSSIFGRNLTGASNLNATLYAGDPSFVQTAVVSTRATDDTFFTYERTATLEPVTLGEGAYGLYVSGLLSAAGSAPAVPSGYRGQLRFGGLAAPGPEPGTWAAVGLGLVGVGLGAAPLATPPLAGGGGDDDDALPTPSTARFGATPVAGLDVQGTGTAAQRTGARGEFRHAAGETVRFSIGALALGSAVGAPTLDALGITAGATAVSDRRVTNKLVLLQTLDGDGDLNNGIQIGDTARGIVSGQAASIDFDQDTAPFRASLAPLLAALEQAGAFTDLDPRARTARTATAAVEHHTRASSPRHEVTTDGGRLSGYQASDGTWQFLGVPYARPPVGELRWKPPQPADAWTGLRDAVAWSDQAAQNPAYQAINEGGMSEDALYLNVTAPKAAGKLPVMVWFHGGAFTILSNNSRQYNNPAGLATQGVVVVTVNHRLGPFGYVAHPQLSAESGHDGSGNYGQMDLVMALQWVKRNIAAFGGDPDNVTVFGQSGGGGKTYALMNSPEATGLFHKAINQSGASPIVMNVDEAQSLAANEAVGTALFARMGVSTLAEARALPWTAVVQADLDANIPREIYRPNVDYRHLPKTYAANVRDGMPSDVPFMVGATSGDYASLRAALPVFMQQRSATYTSPQYVYRFSRVPDGWRDLGLLTAHGGELPYLFNYPAGMVSNYNLNLVLTPGGVKPAIGDLNGNGVTGTDGDAADVFASMRWGAPDMAMVDTTMAMWTNFAKTGNPSIAGLAWPAYTLANDTYMEIGPVGAEVKTGLATAFP